MHGFRPDKFSKKFSVHLMKNQSIADTSKDLQTVTSEIDRRKTDAIYLHIGAADINKGDSPQSVCSKMIDVTDRIAVSRNPDHKPSFDELKRLLSDEIDGRKASTNAAEFWGRVHVNQNSNFLSRLDGSPYEYLASITRNQTISPTEGSGSLWEFSGLASSTPASLASDLSPSHPSIFQFIFNSPS